jgi:hypothetical protein
MDKTALNSASNVIDKWVADNVRNIKKLNSLAELYTTAMNGDCFFDSFMYHLVRTNKYKQNRPNIRVMRNAVGKHMKDFMEKAIAQNQFTDVKPDNDSRMLTRYPGKSFPEDFEPYMFSNAKPESKNEFFYADLISIDYIVKNVSDKTIIILDIIGETSSCEPIMNVFPHPKNNKILSNGVNGDEPNYYIIKRRESHYQPYKYNKKELPQILNKVVLKKINKLLLNCENAESLNLLGHGIEFCTLSLNKLLNPINQNNSKTVKIVNVNVNSNSNIRSKSTRSKSTRSKSTRSKSTRSKSTRSNSTRSKSTRSNSTRSKRISRNKGKKNIQKKEYCLWGCENHIFVWLYDSIFGI